LTYWPYLEIWKSIPIHHKRLRIDGIYFSIFIVVSCYYHYCRGSHHCQRCIVVFHSNLNRFKYILYVFPSSIVHIVALKNIFHCISIWYIYNNKSEIAPINGVLKSGWPSWFWSIIAFTKDQCKLIMYVEHHRLEYNGESHVLVWIGTNV
jgi:hypothetical protein